MTIAASSIEMFLDMMSAERSASRNTLDAYRRDLLAFEEQMGSVQTATRDDIKLYLTRLSRGGAATTSQARRLSSLRQYFGFLYAEGLRPDDPTLAIEAPRRARPLPKTLSKRRSGRADCRRRDPCAILRRRQKAPVHCRNPLCGGAAHFGTGHLAARRREAAGLFLFVPARAARNGSRRSTRKRGPRSMITSMCVPNFSRAAGSRARDICFPRAARKAI